MNPAWNKTCADIAPLLVFYVCDEVNDQERAEIESHLKDCPACQIQLKDEQDFYGVIDSTPYVSEHADTGGILLSRCRSELSEALDDLKLPPVKQKAPPFAFVRYWMMLHPAWSAATLVLLGLVAGTEFSQYFGGPKNVNALDQAVNIRAHPRITEDQLSKMTLAGVDFTPSTDSGSANVRVVLSAEQPLELTGSVDDSDVRNVLTFVVKNGERFDSGLRLDCLDALRARAENTEVRSALLCAARKDQNPAVRLKALEALRDTASDDSVRQALLDALKHDSNPGVRVEAVNLLVRSLESGQQQEVTSPMPSALPELTAGNVVQAGISTAVQDGSLESVIRALGDLQFNDPSRYVRLRSAAALREISARNDQ
jgi:HEAT repeats